MKSKVVPVTPFQQNATLLWDEMTGAGAIVDPGGDLDRILAVAAANKVRIEKILVTHGHLDHAGGVADLRDRLGIPVEGPQREDSFWIEGMAEQAEMFNFSQPVRPFTPDRWLEGGETVEAAGTTLQVIHCPGHTPGHVVFFQPETSLALVGDVIFRGSIGRTDFPRGNHATLLASIRERLFPLGDNVTFVPGHGPLSTFGHERRGNPFLA